ICHADAPLHYEGLASWLASWSSLVGIVIIEEPPARKWQRVRREIRRSGLLGFADVMAFRAFYRFHQAANDARWLLDAQAEMKERFGAVGASVPRVRVSSPNSAATRQFIADVAPDMAFA